MRRRVLVFCAALAALIAIGASVFWFRGARRADADANSRGNTAVFDYLYSRPNAAFTDAPTEFLTSVAPGLPHGDALDIAMGQGRNAVYLARLGWRVTGFDVSEVGLQVARQRGREQGLAIDARRASVDSFDYGRNRWDLVLIIYAPVPFQDAGFMRRLRESIKPGGYVVAEMPVDWDYAHGQPAARQPGDLRPDELRSFFSDYELVRYTEAIGRTEWFPRMARIARMVARKPPGIMY